MSFHSKYVSNDKYNVKMKLLVLNYHEGKGGGTRDH
jgi:hypothetical protein